MEKNKKSIYQSIKIFDLNVFSNSKESLLNALKEQLISARSLISVFTPNPEQIVVSRSNTAFLDHLRSADILIPDGIGLVIASKVLDLSGKGPSLKERISGREVAAELLEIAEKSNLTVLVVGGRDYGMSTQSQTDAHVLPLKQQSDGTTFSHAYWMEGYADVENPTTDEEMAVKAALSKLKPQLVFVAFGAPWQEAWVVDHRAVLEKAGTRVVMVVGGAFDVLLGTIPQAPAWIEAIGLEWLFRLIQEPWRWRRQLKLLSFIKLTFQSI